MSVKKGKGPVFDPGLCRCCGSMKKCRVLNVVYETMGEKVIYSDMMMDCFGLLISHLDGKPTERLICATCVMRLRDAYSFRRQVLQCEEAFLQMKMYDGDRDDSKIHENRDRLEEALVEGAPKEEIQLVKLEPPPPDSDPGDPGSGCEDDGPDYEPPPDLHTEMEIKPEKVEEYPNDYIAQDATAGASATACSVEECNSNDDTPLNKLVIKKNPGKRPNGSLQASQQPSPKKPKLPMSKVQQLMRERDPSYMTETNILTIVEFSYVCPFKCRHNHLLCYYCGQNFADPTQLRDHTETFHHPKKFKVTEHKNMIKIDLTRIDCRLCSESIDSLEKFKQHITNVHEKKYYFNYKDSVLPFRLTKDELKCALCMKVFPYFHALNKHMNEHYSNYVCETCGLGFVDKGRFVMHQQRHDEGDFPCETCGKIFKAQYNRDLHIDRVHKKKGRVYCPKCDIKLMSYPQKLKHLVEVHGEAPLSFPCSMCDKVFETRRMLTIHRRKDHLKDYRYECQCCGQKFFTRFALNNHMPTHTGERNFKCKVCEKCYPRLKTLKDHMRIHTNDRRYRCHICGQAFIQNCSLKGHMKSQHPEY